MESRAKGNANLPCMANVARTGWLWVAICVTHRTAGISVARDMALSVIRGKCRKITEPEQVAEEWWQNQW